MTSNFSKFWVAARTGERSSTLPLNGAGRKETCFPYPKWNRVHSYPLDETVYSLIPLNKTIVPPTSCLIKQVASLPPPPPRWNKGSLYAFVWWNRVPLIPQMNQRNHIACSAMCMETDHLRPARQGLYFLLFSLCVAHVKYPRSDAHSFLIISNSDFFFL